MASWASVTVLAAVLGTALVLMRVLGAGQAVPAGRDAGLEGLRGVLALCVVAHHLLLLRGLAATGAWDGIDDNLGNLLGKSAVAMFFMLSAYLFCGRIERSGGRAPALPFLVARVRRIVPAWVAVLALLFGIVAWESGFALHEPVARVAGELAAWALFPDVRPPDINGRHLTYTILSCSWSLRYEWLFYAGLPLLALGRRRWGVHAPFAMLLLPALLFAHWAFFALGALAVPLAQRRRRRIGWTIGGVAGLALLIGTQHHPGDWMAGLLLFPAFMAVAGGDGAVAGFARPALARLGRTSYGVYLFHNPLLYLVMMRGIGAPRIAGLGSAGLALVAVAATALVLIIAELSWRFVERPFLTGGRGHAALQRHIAVADIASTTPSDSAMMPAMR